MDISKPVRAKGQVRTRLSTGVNRRAFVKLAISGAAAGAVGSPLLAFPKKSLPELPPGIKAMKIFSSPGNSV
jgi:hypothetical protein